MDGCSFELDVSATASCTRCKRNRPVPDEGDLQLQEGLMAVVDTGVVCGVKCLETRVLVRVKLGF